MREWNFARHGIDVASLQLRIMTCARCCLFLSELYALPERSFDHFTIAAFPFQENRQRLVAIYAAGECNYAFSNQKPLD